MLATTHKMNTPQLLTYPIQFYFLFATLMFAIANFPFN